MADEIVSLIDVDAYTHLYSLIQLVDELNELIVYYFSDVMRRGKVCINSIWTHRHEAILEDYLVRNSKALVTITSGQFCASMPPNSPGYHKQQTQPLLATSYLLKTPSALPPFSVLPPASAARLSPASSQYLLVWRSDANRALALHIAPCRLHNGFEYAVGMMNFRQRETPVVFHSSQQTLDLLFKLKGKTSEYLLLHMF